MPKKEIGGLHYVQWTFSKNLKSVAVDFVLGEPSNYDELFFQGYQCKINGILAYFGVQTNVWRPAPVAKWQGRGLIFSRWDTQDSRDFQIVPGGWCEIGAYEGKFVSVRAKFQWEAGRQYRLRLWRDHSEGWFGSDWYKAGILDIETGNAQEIGSLRFPCSIFDSGISRDGITWTELFKKGILGSPVPDWDVVITQVAGDNKKPVSAKSWCSSEMEGTDIWRDDKGVHFVLGPGVMRQHAPETWRP